MPNFTKSFQTYKNKNDAEFSRLKKYEDNNPLMHAFQWIFK